VTKKNFIRLTNVEYPEAEFWVDLAHIVAIVSWPTGTDLYVSHARFTFCVSESAEQVMDAIRTREVWQ
jgi:hypothetical protein